MIPVRVREVLGIVTHECRDCGRPIAPGEYKTEISLYSDNVCWSEYTCCHAPHSVRIGKFPRHEQPPPDDGAPF